MNAPTVTWESPANIAIVKYWGKKGFQIPANPSVSFTLSACKTITSITASPRQESNQSVSFEYFFDSNKNDIFNKRIERFLLHVMPMLPILSRFHLTIHSRNTFPHSAGVASSASSMSALALGLLDLQQTQGEDFIRQASALSRLGSGSACRSLYPHAALWGECSGGSNEYATPVPELHETFKTYRDSVLLVSSKAKTTPSRAGHQSMECHPYRHQRYQVATDRASRALTFLKEGDEDALGNVLEQEALELHALAATATPSCLYMEPNALRIIQIIRHFRMKTKLPLYFSLDAGTNIHLIYPERITSSVHTLIEQDLKPWLERPYVIHDQVGQGPTKIS